MNDVKSEKYGLSPNGIEKKALSNKRFKTLFNTEKIKRSKKYQVLILAERIRKKSAPGKFCKQTVQNISYFNKENVFTVRN